MKTNKIVILLSLLIIANILVAAFYFQEIKKIDDPTSYYDAVRYMMGVKIDTPVPYQRLLNCPLFLGIATAMSSLTHDIYFSILMMNTFFYVAIIFAFFYLSRLVYKDLATSFFATILFSSNYYLLKFGVNYWGDIGGWLFLVLGSTAAIKYHLEKKPMFYYLAILLSVIGVFFKEYGALGMLTLGFLILFSDISWQKKIKKILLAGLLFLILPLSYHGWFYWQYHFHYFSWYQYNYQYYAAGIDNNYNFIKLIKILLWVFSFGWIILLSGLWSEFKNFNKARLILLCSVILPGLAFLIWPSFTQRTTFIIVIPLALISGYGLANLQKKYLAVLAVFLYLVVNYNIPFHANIINWVRHFI
jgi:hypothetical protein